MTPPLTFYFDVGSPYAYLAAERLATVLPEPIEWRPVLLGGLFRLAGRSSWALGDDRDRRAGMAEIERRAQAYGLPPVRWPDPWPADYLFAMRATTHAFALGAGHAFARKAFGDAFQRGHPLEVESRVLDVGTAVGIDHNELRAATQDPAVKQALRDATDAAYERGVIGVPTLAVGQALFWGDDRLEDAAAHLRSASAG